MQLTLDIARPPLRYHGSKFRLADWIVSHMPEHTTYCEPYGGGAGVLLRKSRSRLEIYNDLDSSVVNFFRVLRNPEGCARLARAVALTPFSREEYLDCFQGSDDMVEDARQLVARSYFGFGTDSHNASNRDNGFRTWHWDGRRHTKSYAVEWQGIPDAIIAAAARFQSVIIEQAPALEIIAKYDTPDTLFYVDPPYVRSTRSERRSAYACDMSDHDHRKLAFHLRRVRGKVILSGYDSALYRELFHDWSCLRKSTHANGHFGSVPRDELIWLNFST